MIDARIYDDEENPAYGVVDFQPFYLLEWPGVNTTFSGIVSIGGDIVVPQGATLTIEPGTIVRFASNMDAAAGGSDPTKSELIVYGQLVLTGEPGELPVIFQSDAYEPKAGDWGGIVFQQSPSESKSPESKCSVKREIGNCIIRHAVCGVTVDDKQTLEVKNTRIETNITGASISCKYELKSTTVAENTVAGISFANDAQGKINSCRFENNEVGIYFNGRSKAICMEDTVISNNTGIVCQDWSMPLLLNSVITQNKNNGIKINSSAQPNINCGHNIISYNLPYNIYNASDNTIMAKTNYWGTMDVDTVAKYIFDGKDQTGLGIVSYLPLWEGPKDAQHGGVQLEAGSIAIPTVFALLQNAPNPVVGFTTIDFAVAEPCNVSLKIYNISGQVVKTLVNANKQQGYYNVKWDGKDDSGKHAAAGVYFYRIQAKEFNNTKKLVVLK